MKFENYIDQAWTEHANQPRKVADGFESGAASVETSEQLTQFIALVTHVMGEHLASWAEGQHLLEGLRQHEAFAAGEEVDKAIQRSIAVMKLGRDASQSLSGFEPSDQIRILAVTASSLLQRETNRAKECLIKALAIARLGMGKKDPANRTLAVTGNNVACALEERSPRTQDENELMILAAKTSREFWGIAGGWVEVSRAEYRLGISYLEANDTKKALGHAQKCLEICRENKAGDLDMFFALEVLAKVEKARQNVSGLETALEQATQHLARLDARDKEWCEPILNKLKA